jgi:hypothetical protein
MPKCNVLRLPFVLTVRTSEAVVTPAAADHDRTHLGLVRHGICKPAARARLFAKLLYVDFRIQRVCGNRTAKFGDRPDRWDLLQLIKNAAVRFLCSFEGLFKTPS